MLDFIALSAIVILSAVESSKRLDSSSIIIDSKERGRLSKVISLVR
jgi:hypothetical protein